MAGASSTKKYLVYGDYEEEYQCVPRCDYKVLAFIDADSAEEAFEKWKVQDAWSLHLLEQEVIVREVYAEKQYFTLERDDEEYAEDGEDRDNKTTAYEPPPPTLVLRAPSFGSPQIDGEEDMANAEDECYDSETDLSAEEVMAVAHRIYGAYLPPYLQGSWTSGKGKWYEDWLRRQLDVLVMDELCDDPTRLAALQQQQDYVALVFGIFGTSFRILDHIGMHLRAQTLGQYELMPEDQLLLHNLCYRLLQMDDLDLNPFSFVDTKDEA